MTMLIDVLIQVGLYVLVALFIVILFDIMSVGFWRTWFVVKQSRGQKLMVFVRSAVQDYYRPAKIEDAFLIYKGLNGEKKRLAIPDGSIYRSAGVNCIMVDDVKNAVLLRNFDAVSGYDAEKHESLYLRALYKPTMMDNNTKIMLVLMVVIILGLGLGFYLTHSWIVSSQEATLAAINGLKDVGQVAAQGAGSVASGVV